MAKAKDKRKRYGIYRDLVPISRGKGARTIRAKRCKWIGGDEGGSTYQCGKTIIVHDDVNNHYYRVAGKNAMYMGYAARQRRKYG